MAERATGDIFKKRSFLRLIQDDKSPEAIFCSMRNGNIVVLSFSALFGKVSSKGWLKVQGDGYYGHYHDSTHSFHVWYGEPIRYN